MRRCALQMLLLGAVVWGGCSRVNSRDDAIGAKNQALVDLVEQNYRGWSNRLFMARFEGELLALPEKSDRVRCVRQYLEMIGSKIEMVKNPKDCMAWSDDVFKLVCHGCDMMNHVGYTNDEKVEFLFSFLTVVRDQIENLQSLGPVGSRIEQLERPHDIKSMKTYMVMWKDWIMRYIINRRTHGFNEEERTRFRARLDELMKITQGWREPVGAKPPRGTTNEVQEVEVDI